MGGGHQPGGLKYGAVACRPGSGGAELGRDRGGAGETRPARHGGVRRI
jgi:hypothetical protein